MENDNLIQLQFLFQQAIEKRNKLDQDLEDLKSIIERNGGTVPGRHPQKPAQKNTEQRRDISDILTKSYTESKNWMEKIIYALHELGKPSTTAEVISYFEKKGTEEGKSITKSVQLTITKMFRDGLIGAREESGKRKYHLLKK